MRAFVSVCVCVYYLSTHTKLESAQVSSQEEEEKKPDDNISKTKSQIVQQTSERNSFAWFSYITSLNLSSTCAAVDGHSAFMFFFLVC